MHEFGKLLAEILDLPDGRHWLLGRRIHSTTVGPDMVDELTDWFAGMPAERAAELLIGGVARADLPFKPAGLLGRTMEAGDFVLPPLSNQLFTRDSSCRIYGGAVLGSIYWTARRRRRSM